MTEPLRLEVAGDARDFTATRLLQTLRTGHPNDEYVDVDLRRLRWIEPAGLVLIATFTQSQASIGRRVRLQKPQSRSAENFVSRMHLGDVIADHGGDHDLRVVDEEPLPNSLLELQKFSGSRGASDLAALVRHRLPSAGQGLARAMYNGIAEIGENVHLHARTAYGYVAAVHYPNKNRLMFAVADAGRGLLRSLGPKGFLTEEDIIEKLFDHGISSLPQPGAGRGVRSTRDLVVRERGRILMASGGAAIEDSRGPQPRIRFTGDHAIPGTLLQANLPTRGSRNLDIDRSVVQ